MAFGAIGSREDSLPADAQRLVPAGPLLELVDRWRRARNMHREHALTITEDDDRPDWDDDVMALEYELRAAELSRLLAALLGESPEPNAQEGNHG